MEENNVSSKYTNRGRTALLADLELQAEKKENNVSSKWAIRRYTTLIADLVSLAENETDKLAKDFTLGYAETLCGMLTNKVKELHRSAKEPSVLPEEVALERENRLEKEKDE